MAEPRQNRSAFQIQVFYSFDRLLEPKLARAYEILVPCREHPVGVRTAQLAIVFRSRRALSEHMNSFLHRFRSGN